MYQKPRKAQVAAVFGSIILVLGGGTIMFHALEDWTWIQSFYFTVATSTTVGYGDIHPTSDISRLATSFFILFGVGILVSAIGYIGSFFIKRSEERLIENHKKKHPDQHKV